MYLLECHTCDDAETFPDRPSAQAVFNDHAEHRHDVVLRRVDDPSSTRRQPDSAGDAAPSDATGDDAGAEGGDPVAD